MVPFRWEARASSMHKGRYYTTMTLKTSQDRTRKETNNCLCIFQARGCCGVRSDALASREYGSTKEYLARRTIEILRPTLVQRHPPHAPIAYPVQKQRLAGGYRDRFLHRPVRYCSLRFFDRSAAVQQSGDNLTRRRSMTWLHSRWREIRARNDNACGESKSQNSHESLLDLTFLIAVTDHKAPIY